jgi:hypothetical protein
MSKKVWVSLPLITTTDLKDEAVVGFLKGGVKKELDTETAVFITKWLMDKSVPFSIDFDSAMVDQNAVLEALPRRLQRLLPQKGAAAGGTDTAEAVAGETGDAQTPVEATGEESPSVTLEPDGTDEQKVESDLPEPA